MREREFLLFIRNLIPADNSAGIPQLREMPKISSAAGGRQHMDEIAGKFHAGAAVKTEKRIGDFLIDAKRMQPLGIIANEILTNIIKYAFTGRDDGLITVSASLKNNHNG
jgi:hypothetical protein